MKFSNVSGDCKPWKVELDVRDLGGHLDLTKRARAGTFSRRVKELRMGWPRLIHSSWGFRLSWAWFGESICLLGCALLKLHTSLLRLSLPLVQLLYGPSGPVRCPWQILQLYSICWMVWLACHIVWAKFRMMRRYLT